MKRTILTLLILLAGISMSAQNVQDAASAAAVAIANAEQSEVVPEKPKYWKNSLAVDLGFNQTGLFSWAAGGYNTLTLSTGLDAKADYAKDLTSWTNRLQLNYGFLWSADKRNLLQKSNDRIYLESKLSFKTGEKSKWNYTAAFDFRSQFTDSYSDYVAVDPTNPQTDWTGTLKSGWLSPAYTNLALGMEWNPAPWFNVILSPVTSGLTIVTNPLLRQQYGMQPSKDVPGAFNPVLFQFGAQIKANAKWVINDKFNFESQLVLFTDYLNKPFENNRVNWDNKIEWQVSKIFKVGLNTWLIYDPIVYIKEAAHPDGIQKVQFKEFLSFSITYTFKNKK